MSFTSYKEVFDEVSRLRPEWAHNKRQSVATTAWAAKKTKAQLVAQVRPKGAPGGGIKGFFAPRDVTEVFRTPRQWAEAEDPGVRVRRRSVVAAVAATLTLAWLTCPPFLDEAVMTVVVAAAAAAAASTPVGTPEQCFADAVEVAVAAAATPGAKEERRLAAKAALAVEAVLDVEKIIRVYRRGVEREVRNTVEGECAAWESRLHELRRSLPCPQGGGGASQLLTRHRWATDTAILLSTLRQDAVEFGKRLRRRIQNGNSYLSKSGMVSLPRIYVEAEAPVCEWAGIWDYLEFKAKGRVLSRRVGYSNQELMAILLDIRANGTIDVRSTVPELIHGERGEAQKEMAYGDAVSLAQQICALCPCVCTTRQGQVLISDVEALRVPADDEGEAEEDAGTLPRRGGRGRPQRIEERYPGIVAFIRDMLSASGTAAHARRRTESAGIGVTAAEIRKACVESGMNVSEWSIRRLFTAPHEWRVTANLYKGLLMTRLLGSRDDGRCSRPEAHHCAAQVKLTLELAVWCNKKAERSGDPDEFMAISMDAKALVPVGACAVSKHIRRRRYVMEGKRGVSTPDHDWNTAHALKPMVYCTLGLAESKRVVDLHGRPRWSMPRNGSLDIVIRPTKLLPFNAETVVRHLDDVLRFRATVPPVLTLVVDNASDVAPTAQSGTWALARLFGRHPLRAIVVTSYAGGHSAYNMVERTMAFLSGLMAGHTYGRDDGHPDGVYRAAAELAKDLDGKSRKGHDVRCTAVQGDEDELAAAAGWDQYPGQQQVLYAGAKRAKTLKLTSQYRDLVRHIKDRRRNLCLIVRCDFTDCAFCAGGPKPAPTPWFDSVLEKGFPTPVPSDVEDAPEPADIDDVRLAAVCAALVCVGSQCSTVEEIDVDEDEDEDGDDDKDEDKDVASSHYVTLEGWMKRVHPVRGDKWRPGPPLLCCAACDVAFMTASELTRHNTVLHAGAARKGRSRKKRVGVVDDEGVVTRANENDEDEGDAGGDALSQGSGWLSQGDPKRGKYTCRQQQPQQQQPQQQQPQQQQQQPQQQQQQPQQQQQQQLTCAQAVPHFTRECA